MPAVTINNINAALKAEGFPIEIVKGDCYFYFSAVGDAPAGIEDAIDSIYSNHLRAMTIEQYVDHVRTSIKDWEADQ